jgi:iron(II)-dependent oxidoreductase
LQRVREQLQLPTVQGQQTRLPARSQPNPAQKQLLGQIKLRDEEFAVRVRAIAGLLTFGNRFVQEIQMALADPYPQVRLAAIRALEQLCTDEEWHDKLVYECYVPAGSFVIGADNSPSESERPACSLSVAAFYIDRYPVTNAEYMRYKQALNQPFEYPPGKANHPVVQLSWPEAQAYAAWTGMRLLTEAEWEKAASWNDQTGQKQRYAWGDDQEMWGNVHESGKNDTSPVGAYSVNGDTHLGVSDMTGNVWEWCSSFYESYPYNVEQADREGINFFGQRVRRGGSFNTLLSEARATARWKTHPEYQDKETGFRLGCSTGQGSG